MAKKTSLGTRTIMVHKTDKKTGTFSIPTSCKTLPPPKSKKGK